MKRTWFVGGMLVVAAALLAAGIALEPARAQNRGEESKLYVINLSKVFKDYKKYQALSESFKAEVETKQKTITQREAELKGKVSGLPEIKNAGDRERMEKEIANQKFSLDLDKRKYESELSQKEADMFMTIYKDVTDLLSKYCDRFGIHMVLRVYGDPEGNSPVAANQAINRQVVYYNPSLDLTKIITDGLNQRFAVPAPADK